MPEMALEEPSEPPPLRPGGTLGQAIWRGASPGWSRAIRAGIGPASLVALVARIRSDDAKWLAVLVVSLDLVLESADPRAALKRKGTSGPGDRYLGIVAEQVSGLADGRLVRRVIARHVSNVRREAKMLAQQARTSPQR